MIRELEAREIEKIYREEMTGDFPAEELKPIDLILRLKAEGRYCAFGNFEGEKLTAYAFLIHEKDDPVYLLDFFAVCRGGRDQGIGSTFIRELLHKLNPEFWILEVEDIASAANEEEREIRTRRMDFYHKNGVKDTTMYTCQYGVNLKLLYLSEKEITGDIEPGLYEKLDAIYQFTFGERYQDGTVTLMKPERLWWKEAVVYQIYPRSFKDSNGDGIGALRGIIEKMDYLQELGVDVIWLSPIYESPNDDNGYDISNYQAIMKEFGTMEDFDEMLVSAHAHGLRLVMDLVVNHTSDEHPWFVESRKSVDNPYRDYYIWREGKDGKFPNNWGSCFTGNAWEFDERTQMYYLHLFSKKQPDLNWENPKVREEVFRMMNWWLDKGVDGFRMDVLSLLSKEPGLPDLGPVLNGYAVYNACANGPRVHEYIQEMRRKVLNRADTITVGECCAVTLEEAKKYASRDGREVNMVFQFEHMDVDSDGENKWTDKKMDLRKMKEVLTRWEKGLEGIAWNSLFWENHDQPRSVSRYADDGRYRVRSAKMLATCLHMMQGTPYVYQGEELGMTNAPFQSVSDFRDLDSINAYRDLVKDQKVFTEEEMLRFLRKKSRDNARTPFQWDDSENGGFTTGTPWIMVNPNYKEINAKEELADPASVFYYYQKLIRLRKENPIMVYGTYDLLLPESETIYAYTRTLGKEKLLVVCSFSGEEETFDCPEEFVGTERFLTNCETEIPEKCPEKLVLPPWGAVVYHLKG